MLRKDEFLNSTFKQLLEKYPFIKDYMDSHSIAFPEDEEILLSKHFNGMNASELEDNGINKDLIIEQIVAYINEMLDFLGGNEDKVQSITIIAGNDKSGKAENYERLTISINEVISIVGPTGSGKSRLLADIEWLARADTPTGRRILINGKEPELNLRFSVKDKLVAQLSQNMNFVIDLSVKDFITLHAESRMIENSAEVVNKIIIEANKLAGEAFSPNVAVTSLSGGQSRALMIADVAFLSRSPVVLIDEIENAGIDRKKALDLLVSNDKIVLMATHDPVLALMASKRIVIKNGGISKIINTNESELSILSELEDMYKKMLTMQNALRRGDVLKM